MKLSFPKLRLPKLGLQKENSSMEKKVEAKVKAQVKAKDELKFTVKFAPVITVGKVVKEYDVGMAHIIITQAGDRHFYVVKEPELNEIEAGLYNELMEAIYYSFSSSGKEDEMAELENFIWKASEDLEIVDQVKASYSKLKYYIARDSLGFGIIDVPIKDDGVEEISCEGWDKPVAVIHRGFSGYDWLDTNIKFTSEDELARFVQKITMRSGKSISTAIPYADATLPDGSRLASTFGNEISMPGSSFDIRKFPKDPFTAPKLIASGTLSPLLVAYYWLILEAKGFTFIIGGTGSGKTTTPNTLLQLINPNMKIATIEETLEINIPHTHWERLKTRYTFGSGSATDIDIFDLTKLTLRIRPDYVIVGEARGQEIQFLFQASACGHGALSTFHGDSVESAVARMMSEPLNVGRAQLMLVWSIMQVNRVRLDSGDVVRRVIVSKEVDPMTGNFTELFHWDAREDKILPDNASEVVEKSVRLEALEHLWGWDKTRLEAELNERADFLKELVNRRKLSMSEITSELRKFYARKYYKVEEEEHISTQPDLASP